MIRVFKYRLYPDRLQVAALELHLSEACRLYNAALQERRDAWGMSRKRITRYSQDKQLKEIRAAGDIGIVSFSCARDVLMRVDRAFVAFYRRSRSGDKPGYPRFKSSHRFDSIAFEIGHGASAPSDGKIRLQGIGQVKLKLHRPLAGAALVAIVKREAGRWYVSIATEVGAERLQPVEHSVGIDVGLTSFAVLSDATVIDNPRHGRRAERAFRVAQRRVARRQRRSNRRKKAVHLLQRAHVRLANQRADFHHKVSREIVNAYGRIAVEDLNIKGLARTRLAKSIHDAGWRSFIDKLAYKAESAGREFVKVNAAGTSQTCLCGARVPKTLSVRTHVCPECGFTAPRDFVSAVLIERLGRSRQALSHSRGEVCL